MSNVDFFRALDYGVADLKAKHVEYLEKWLLAKGA